MCIGCWQDYGCPRVVTPKVIEAARLVAAVYELSCVGGNLHIVVDDWNLEKSSMKVCSDQINRGGYDGRDSSEQLAADRACCDALMKLTEEERASALAVQWGFINEDGTLTEFAARCLAPGPEETQH